jgi:hypothetical protein
MRQRVRITRAQKPEDRVQNTEKEYDKNKTLKPDNSIS